MGVFANNAITDAGHILLADVQAGAEFRATRLVMGSGYLPNGVTVRSITTVVTPVKSLSINKKERTPDGKVIFGGVYSNEDITAPFYFREFALYAKAVYRNDAGVVTKEGEEVLYSYGNAGATADLMAAYSTSTVVERQMDLVSWVGNDAKVDLTIESGVYVTSKQVETMLVDLTDAMGKTVAELRDEISKAGKVKSVNGKEGDVLLSASDIGTANGGSIEAELAKKANGFVRKIAAGEDLDNFYTFGSYYVVKDDVASVIHSPFTGIGYHLYVMRADNLPEIKRTIQVAVKGSVTANSVAMRIHNENGWSGWVAVATQSELDKYLPLIGGTMSGQVKVHRTEDWGQFIALSKSGNLRAFEADDSLARIDCRSTNSTDNRRVLDLVSAVGEPDIAHALYMINTVAGSGKKYYLYGEHNKPTPAAIGAAPAYSTMTATSATLANGSIELTLPDEAGTVQTGSEVKFTAPCTCQQVTGGLIIEGETYTVCDAMGARVTGVGGVWANGANLAVLIDKAEKRAYLQTSTASHVLDTTKHVTAEEKASWNAKAGPADLAAVDFSKKRTIVIDQSGTWVAPSNIAGNKIHVIACGGGGGGGGKGDTVIKGGGGGGGSGYITIKDIPVTPGTSYNVVIGAGGAGGKSYGSGATGGTTTFGGSLLTAAGGQGGGAATSTKGGKGGNGNAGGGGGSGWDGITSTRVVGGDGGSGSDYGGGGGAGGDNTGTTTAATVGKGGAGGTYGGGGGGGVGGESYNIYGKGGAGGAYGGAGGTKGANDEQPGKPFAGSPAEWYPFSLGGAEYKSSPGSGTAGGGGGGYGGNGGSGSARGGGGGGGYCGDGGKGGDGGQGTGGGGGGYGGKGADGGTGAGKPDQGGGGGGGLFADASEDYTKASVAGGAGGPGGSSGYAGAPGRCIITYYVTD